MINKLINRQAIWKCTACGWSGEVESITNLMKPEEYEMSRSLPNYEPKITRKVPTCTHCSNFLVRTNVNKQIDRTKTGKLKELSHGFKEELNIH